jgi:hypothetical protein
MFDNYGARGDAFAAAVHAHIARTTQRDQPDQPDTD